MFLDWLIIMCGLVGSFAVIFTFLLALLFIEMRAIYYFMEWLTARRAKLKGNRHE